MTLRPVLLCVLVLVAGCATVSTGDGPTSGEPTGTPTLTPADAHPGLTADLAVRVDTHRQTTVQVTELGGGGRGVVFEETGDAPRTLRFGGGSVVRENGRYRVVVRVNGTVRWERTVRHFESYELRVERNGTVTVVSQAIA